MFRKKIDLSVAWMPSHLDTDTSKTRPTWVTDRDVLGNSIADSHADIAADGYKVSLQTATDCIFYYKLVKAVQWRLVTISQNLPKRSKYKTVKTVKEEEKTLQQKCEESKHQLQREGERMTCTVCMDSFLVKDASFLHWLAGSCVASHDAGNRIQNKSLHVGNQFVHFTHELRDHRGFVYCKKCGCRSTTLIKLLAKPCQPPGQYGDYTLKCIREDRLPPGLSEWPRES